MVAVEKGPQRTCVTCRQTKDKKQLVRYVVAPGGAVLVDYLQRLPGRGAYTCIDKQCLLDAVKRNSFQRCFKCQVLPVDPLELAQQLTQAIEKKITSLIGMARKSRQFIAGSNGVIEALKNGSSLALVIIATDISASIAKKIEGLALRGPVEMACFCDKQTMGKLLGKEERSVIAIQTGLLADSLLNELHRYRQLVREN